MYNQPESRYPPSCSAHLRTRRRRSVRHILCSDEKSSPPHSDSTVPLRNADPGSSQRKSSVSHRSLLRSRAHQSTAPLSGHLSSPPEQYRLLHCQNHSKSWLPRCRTHAPMRFRAPLRGSGASRCTDRSVRIPASDPCTLQQCRLRSERHGIPRFLQPAPVCTLSRRCRRLPRRILHYKTSGADLLRAAPLNSRELILQTVP